MSLYVALADDLRRQILSGELAPGERLPTEPELSELHGVSRSTVREALRVLTSQNLVITARGVTGGTFVAQPKAGAISDYLETSFGMLAVHDKVGVEELLEVRDLLEVPAAGLAARRVTPDDLAELRTTLVDPRTTDLDAIQEANHRFHALLVKAAGNALLDAVATPVFQVLMSRGVREPVVDAAYWDGVVHDHRAILEAVAAGDGAAASRCMDEHLRRLRDTYTLRQATVSAPDTPG